MRYIVYIQIVKNINEPTEQPWEQLQKEISNHP